MNPGLRSRVRALYFGHTQSAARFQGLLLALDLLIIGFFIAGQFIAHLPWFWKFAETGDAELCGAPHPGTVAGDHLASGLPRPAPSGASLVTAGYGVLSWNGQAWINSVESPAGD